MSNELTASEMGLLYDLWRYSAGGAWQPIAPKHPFFKRMIAAGYLRRCDGAGGVEPFKDSHLSWTDAGRRLMAADAGAAA